MTRLYAAAAAAVAGLAAAVLTATPGHTADPRPVRACITSTVDQPRGATVLRTTTRICTGGLRIVTVQLITPGHTVLLPAGR